MKKTLMALAAAGIAFGVSAKLPAPDDAAKAKAAEAAAKAAWQGKVDTYQLCKVQDKIAAKFGKHDGKPEAKATPASAKPASGASAASGSTSTPAVASAPPACMDAGPFAYNAPEQKPLETSGAHSPAGNATSPPSVKANSAEMKPAEKTAAKK